MQILLSLVTPTSGSSVTDPGLLAWEQAAAVGTGLWIIGAITFALSCGLLLAQAASSIRWAGVQMMAGAFLSAEGILSLPSRVSVGGSTVFLGPSVGLFLGILASVIALIPFVKRSSEDDWTRTAEAFFTTRDPVTLHLRALNAGLSPVSPPAHPELRLDLPQEPTPAPAPPSRRFCPTCGRWYLGGEQACGRDGTPLKPVASDET